MPLSASIPVNSYSPCPAPPSGWVGGFQLTSSPACERELSLATVLRLRFGDQAVAGEKRGAPGQSCPLKPEGGREHTDRLRSDRREGDQDRELCRLESVRAELGLIHPGQLARLAPCGEAMAAHAKLKVHLVGHCDTCICTFMRCKVACDAPHAPATQRHVMSALPPIATAKADLPQKSCPLYPQKRTCAVQLGMSALGQERTWAATNRKDRREAVFSEFRSD